MSSYSEGQTHQLMERLQAMWFTPEDVTKLGQLDKNTLLGIQGVVRGTHEIKPVVRNWREENGVIYLALTSDSTTGAKWEKWFDANGYKLSDLARKLLHSPEFCPTTSVTYNLAILKGEFFSDADRITSKIRAEGERRGWKQGKEMNPEISCLFRRTFSNQEIEAMGLYWIIAMHEPIKDSDGCPNLLGASRSGGGRWLSADWGRPGGRWLRENGFAFLVSQVASV